MQWRSESETEPTNGLVPKFFKSHDPPYFAVPTMHLCRECNELPVIPGCAFVSCDYFAMALVIYRQLRCSSCYAASRPECEMCRVRPANPKCVIIIVFLFSPKFVFCVCPRSSLVFFQIKQPLKEVLLKKSNKTRAWLGKFLGSFFEGFQQFFVPFWQTGMPILHVFLFFLFFSFVFSFFPH